MVQKCEKGVTQLLEREHTWLTPVGTTHIFDVGCVGQLAVFEVFEPRKLQMHHTLQVLTGFLGDIVSLLVLLLSDSVDLSL